MLKTLTLVLLTGMVVALSSLAQQTVSCNEKDLAAPQATNPASNADLRRLLLTQQELRNVEGFGEAWLAGTLDVVPGAREFGIFGSSLAPFVSLDQQKLEIRLHSFEKDENATAEEKAKNFIFARVKDAESDKNIVVIDPRKAESEQNQTVKDFNKEITSAASCHCFGRDVAYIRGTLAARDGSANSLKLYFRLRGIVVSLEMANFASQAASPASTDPRDAKVLRAAIAAKTKLCASPFVKPKS